MYKVTSRWPHQDSVKVEWNITRYCNYDCSYCPPEIHDPTAQFADFSRMKQAVDQLANIGKPIRLSFTGGEPTHYPMFKELLEYCRGMGITWISVTTNGSRKFQWYSDASELVDQWVFSLHFEFKWDDALANIVRLQNERWAKNILVHVMALHTKMPDVRDAANVLSIHSIPHAIRRIRWTEGEQDLFNDLRYDLDDLEWIKSYSATVSPNCVIDNETTMHANDIIKLHYNQFKDWKCNAGIESLMINWDGEVHRATCRVGGSLGNIYTGIIQVPSEPITCTRNYCTCAADIPLTKINVLVRGT